MSFDLIHRVDDGGVHVVRVVGEMDNAVAYRVSDEVTAALVDEVAPSAVVLDLEGLTFIDSTGLGALIRARQAADRARVRFALRSVPRRTRDLLVMTGLERDFDLE